ncbi:MAG: hypothetical protein A2W25_00530 [candidate division Zixibacteria bacterium RBG_16_53_22]|nr:MAG: hypothetical protein A2W25_00530 [candidate division Zixibacteria bacterium RBG_16_53_22]
MRPFTTFNLKQAVVFFLILAFRIANAQTGSYSWKPDADLSRAICSRIAVPSGFARVPADSDSFADWLRHLPLKDDRPPVMLYDGEQKVNQGAHFAVLDIDVGRENLQQCADAVIRLRAEYFYSKHHFDLISFNFTNGDSASFSNWLLGYRPVIDGNKSKWIRSESVDSSYANFRRYLDCVFTYAGTLSLSRELEKVDNAADISISDVFIRGGKPGTSNPGHAVIVTDLARDTITGQAIFILAQSYMPAQDIHILKNPNDSAISPWYRLPHTKFLHTPEWDFKIDELKRFK